MNNFGTTLKMLRSQKGISLSNVADATRIKVTVYNSIEKGEYIPQKERMGRIIEYLGLSQAEHEILFQELCLDLIMREIRSVSNSQWLYPKETKSLFLALFKDIEVICPLVTSIVKQRLMKEAEKLGIIEAKDDYGFFSDELVSTCIARCQRSLKKKVSGYGAAS